MRGDGALEFAQPLGKYPPLPATRSALKVASGTEGKEHLAGRQSVHQGGRPLRADTKMVYIEEADNGSGFQCRVSSHVITEVVIEFPDQGVVAVTPVCIA